MTWKKLKLKFNFEQTCNPPPPKSARVLFKMVLKWATISITCILKTGSPGHIFCIPNPITLKHLNRSNIKILGGLAHPLPSTQPSIIFTPPPPPNHLTMEGKMGCMGIGLLGDKSQKIMIHGGGGSGGNLRDIPFSKKYLPRFSNPCSAERILTTLHQ